MTRAIALTASVCFLIVINLITISSSTDSSSGTSHSWDFWWAYDGISGPEYWGLINPEWSLCSRGKRQSPIDIRPEQLLFDPTLESIHISGNLINGTIENTGRGVVIQVNQSFTNFHDSSTTGSSSSSSSSTSTKNVKLPLSPSSSSSSSSSSSPVTSSPSSPSPSVNSNKIVISRGPLSYNYTLDHIIIHYAADVHHGSEHLIDGNSFPVEIQFYTYNSQLYSSWKDAESKPNGIASIALLALIANGDTASRTNLQFKLIAEAVKASSLKGGQPEFVTGLSIVNLLPSNTLHYLTYEGSLTQPSCYENVNWIILNKPIYISNHDLNVIKNSINGYGDNFRPVQPIARRCIRTNIDFYPTSGGASSTSSSFSHKISPSSSLSSPSSNSPAVNSIDGKFQSNEHSNSNGKACSISRFATYKSLARVTSSSSASSSSTSHSRNSIGL